jgi:uncharacterized protein (DUF2267 family)
VGAGPLRREFLDQIAEREGISRDDALDHTRAVFAALREMITSKEFRDMAAQLPDEYAPLLAATA